MTVTNIAPLPSSVVEKDHRLEASRDKGAEALMEHRYHWTLDESNPKRIPIREYARLVDRSHTAIRKDAKGWESFVARRSGGNTNTEKGGSAADERELVGRDEDWRAAAEAVARARGRNGKPISIVNVRQHHGDEVDEVLRGARRHAEREHRLPTEKDFEKIAVWLVKAERKREEDREREKRDHGMTYVKADGALDKAKRDMVKAIEHIIGTEFDAEERDLLLHTIGEVTEACDLARSAVMGKSGSTFTRKFEVLKGGVAS